MPDNEPVNAWALGMRDLIGPGEETPTGPDVALADIFAALRDPLANLTDSSASTTVRTAILNQRAALDALLAATVNLTGLPIPDLPADPDLIPPDPTRLRSPR